MKKPRDNLMDRWSKYWVTFPKKYGELEFLKQVGKTVGGKEISECQFEAMLEGLMSSLQLHPSDRVLDLCCGNGLITKKIAKKCHQIFGIDQSDYLIQIARNHNSANNIEYERASILDFDFSNHSRFSKIYMYEALQHFRKSQFVDILDLFSRLSKKNVTILLASVPDKNLIWEFYNTEERRKDYLRRKSAGIEAIGTWWDRSYLEKIARGYGYFIEFLNQNPILHTAHYRFDLLLKRT